MKAKVGNMVRIKCNNRFFNGKIGTVVLHKEKVGVVYGLCILIQGLIYGFDEDEVEIINESR